MSSMDASATNVVQDPSHSLMSSGLSTVPSKDAQVEVIVVPFPCHSHLNQLLHLSCLIAAHNIPVHYATSATHLRHAKLRFDSQTRLQNSNIHFHEFPTPHFLSPAPNPNSSFKFPSHLQPSFDASMNLRQPTAALLRKVSATARRVVVIHDILMAYVVQDVGALPNAESYMFYPVSAFHFSLRQMKDPNSVEDLFKQLKGIPSLEGFSTPEFQNLVSLQHDFLSLPAGTIINSCRSIEGTYIDLLAKQMNGNNKQIWAVGPLNHGTKSDRRGSNNRHECLEWLDKQVPKSVLYVSFGTTTSMADEQIKEIAIGLQQSKQKFIWILRDADKGDIFAGDVKRAQLPEGYEESMKEFGFVVRDWVPQVEILGHPSTGWFMSHCGWNSCLESITMGVPIAAWPMHSDQPRNAFLVTDMLKVGVVVNAWEKREEIVNSSIIARAVKSLMASKEGEETRKRVEEMGSATRQAVKKGGVSCLELYSFVAHITRE